jgi:predicted nuclease of restriction endonuclease-like (RecB) superfamily
MVRMNLEEPDELPPSAADTLTRIREILSQARHRALQSINTTMIHAYWNVGREIAEEEQLGQARAGYGTRLMATLARKLQEEFGKGFNETNLRYARQFYLTYPIHHALRDELSWTHYRLLLSVKEASARKFYEVEAVRASWSTRELDRQIHSSLYERLALSRDQEGMLRLTEQGAEAAQPEDLLRDPFVLEFTGLGQRERFTENELEKALMNRLQSFLLELGTDFFFVARQKRLLIDDEWCKVDLVFYHRTLRCFVLIDLKMAKITSRDVGQMLSYVGYYAENEQREGENPPIGILLGAGKSEEAVRYALTGTTQSIFAARYQLHLPTEAQLLDALVRQRDSLLLERRLEGEGYPDA